MLWVYAPDGYSNELLVVGNLFFLEELVDGLDLSVVVLCLDPDRIGLQLRIVLLDHVFDLNLFEHNLI